MQTACFKSSDYGRSRCRSRSYFLSRGALPAVTGRDHRPADDAPGCVSDAIRNPRSMSPAAALGHPPRPSPAAWPPPPFLSACPVQPEALFYRDAALGEAYGSSARSRDTPCLTAARGVCETCCRPWRAGAFRHPGCRGAPDGDDHRQRGQADSTVYLYQHTFVRNSVRVTSQSRDRCSVSAGRLGL